MRYREIAEACWKGFHKSGMKTMFGKRYPNCVKNKKKSNEAVAEAHPNQQISRFNPDGTTYRGNNKMPQLDPHDPVHNAERFGLEHDEPYDHDDAHDAAELERVMAKQLSTLTDREQSVIRARFYDNMTLAALANVMNLTTERVRQIEAKALRKLKHSSRSDQLRAFASQDVEETTMAQSANRPAGPKFGGYYGATQKGAPKAGQSFGGAAESVNSKISIKGKK